jgi:hypothetical protein
MDVKTFEQIISVVEGGLIMCKIWWGILETNMPTL